MRKRIIILCLITVPLSPLRGTPSTEHTYPWTKTYRNLKDVSLKLEQRTVQKEPVSFLLLAHPSYLQTIPVDGISVGVLKEFSDAALLYREGLQRCIESPQNSYRRTSVYSFEYFGWFLDSYLRTLRSVFEPEEGKNTQTGIRSQKIMSEQALYAYTRLLTAYLEERIDRFEASGQRSPFDREFANLTNDVARRVLKLDLNVPFNRKQAIEKGMRSQPGLSGLPDNSPDIDLGFATEPLIRLTQSREVEPTCTIVQPGRTPEQL